MLIVHEEIYPQGFSVQSDRHYEYPFNQNVIMLNMLYAFFFHFLLRNSDQRCLFLFTILVFIENYCAIVFEL